MASLYTVHSLFLHDTHVSVEIVTRGDPYPGMTAMEAALAVYQSGYRLAIPENCPAGIAEVIKSCWNNNPEERPDFEQMSNYFRDIPEESWLFK